VKLSRGSGSNDEQRDGKGDTTGSRQASLLQSLDDAPSRVPGDTHLSVTGLTGRADVFQRLVRSRLFLLVTVLTALGYLSFFKYLDLVTDAPVMATPSYFVLFYALIAASSFLMGLNVYSLRSRLAKSWMRRSGVAGGSSSAVTSLFSGVISCSCHTSLLLPTLSFLGLSTISGIGVVTALVEYQLWTLAVFIVVNLYLAFRILDKIRRHGGVGPLP